MKNPKRVRHTTAWLIPQTNKNLQERMKIRVYPQPMDILKSRILNRNSLKVQVNGILLRADGFLTEIFMMHPKRRSCGGTNTPKDGKTSKKDNFGTSQNPTGLYSAGTSFQENGKTRIQKLFGIRLLASLSSIGGIKTFLNGKFGVIPLFLLNSEDGISTFSNGSSGLISLFV